MFNEGALCILNLLNVYRLWLLPDSGEEHSPTEQPRNLDILHLQAMMKVWQIRLPSPSRDRPHPAREEELEFVRQMVECVRLFAACSSDLWNAKVEKEMESQIAGHQGWSGEGETVPLLGYKYVKTVDQAFPSNFTMENITSHRQELNEIKARREKDIQQRKMAWGDNKVAGGSECRLPASNQPTRNPSGDSQTMTPKKTRPLSAKKQGPSPVKFDLSKSVFKEHASSPPPSATKRAEAARVRVRQNVLTAGYGKRPAVSINKDRQDESAIEHDEDRELHHKRLRLRLFQDGVCETVGPWVAFHQEPKIQVW